MTDWTATFSTNVDFTNLPANEDPRNYVQNVILAPIGGRYSLYGLWQPVTLLSVPPVSIDECLRDALDPDATTDRPAHPPQR